MQAQFARMMGNSPLGAMSELTRQNLEMWTKMQETMLAAFAPPPARETQKDEQQDADEPRRSDADRPLPNPRLRERVTCNV